MELPVAIAQSVKISIPLILILVIWVLVIHVVEVMTHFYTCKSRVILQEPDNAYTYTQSV